MPATKVQLIGGNFQDNEGNVLVSGYLKLRLSSDEQVPGVGQICAGVVTTINLNSSGAVDTSTPQLVWGNDQMVPANNFYVVEGFKSNGQLAWGPNNQQVIGSGGTYDVGQWIPNTVVSWTYPAAFGPTGPTGSGAGFTGPTGPAGSTGATGATGGVVAQSGPRPSLGNWRLWSSSGTTTQFQAESVGCLPNNVTPGSITAIAPTSSEPAYVQFSNSGATGSQAIFGDNRGGGSPRNFTLATLKVVQYRIQLPATTTIRMWMAANDHANSTEGVFVSNNPVANLVGFRYSTSAGDVNWQAYCGTDGTHFTTADTGVAADTAGHVFQIAFSGGNVLFSIDNVQKASISTNVPSTSQVLGNTFSMDNAGTPNVVAFNAAYSYTETSA